MIIVENLCYEYPEKRVLHNISFHVSPGSITALVGPNGAGKTTLLRCMAALDEPFSGNIFIDGADAFTESRETHKKLGYLSDFFGLYEDLTVEQSLIFAAAIHKLSHEQIKKHVAWAASILGFSNRLQEKASMLSRGWRQRLGIAQAIIHKPSLLLLDEPASGLDPEARIELSRLFKQLRDNGMTLLVSSHILAELEDYCTDMLILRDGVIVGHQPSTHAKVNIHIKMNFLNLANDIKIELIKNTYVSRVMDVDKNSLSFEFSGDEMDRINLLKTLLSKNFEITDFYTKHDSLQHVYMSMSQEKASHDVN